MLCLVLFHVLFIRGLSPNRCPEVRKSMAVYGARTNKKVTDAHALNHVASHSSEQTACRIHNITCTPESPRRQRGLECRSALKAPLPCSSSSSFPRLKKIHAHAPAFLAARVNFLRSAPSKKLMKGRDLNHEMQQGEEKPMIRTEELRTIAERIAALSASQIATSESIHRAISNVSSEQKPSTDLPRSTSGSPPPRKPRNES